MRGNEDSIEITYKRLLDVPIHMRGNEAVYRRDSRVFRWKFPIPMKGNETVMQPGAAPVFVRISDSHEGNESQINTTTNKVIQVFPKTDRRSGSLSDRHPHPDCRATSAGRSATKPYTRTSTPPAAS